MTISLVEKNKKDIYQEDPLITLINSSEIKRDIKGLYPVKGGANNRIYRLECGDRSLLLKIYYRDPLDLRDRLNTEFLFLKFLWSSGVKDVPEPYTCDTENGMAIYEWIEGSKLTPDTVKREHVVQAIDFFIRLNANRDKAGDIPNGSEACFSLSEHIRTVDKRMGRLLKIEGSAEIDVEAKDFVEAKLHPLWEKIKEKLVELARLEDMDLEREIETEDRCLSPSDFGFHNAIVTSGNRLKFIDFEYAGWDDPAKTVCDFFCQPEIPVPKIYFHMFKKGISKVVRDRENLYKRIDMLFPVYQLKWCCIVLNEFIASDEKRRRFAFSDSDVENRKIIQLKKATEILKNIKI